MTTPANLTYDQIEERVMNSLRIPISNATERTKVAAVINETYRDICAKQDWWWLKKYWIINTDPAIKTGTVAVTENTAAVTFSDVPRRPTLDGSTGDLQYIGNWLLSVSGQAADPNALYRIQYQYVTGDVTASLDFPYTGITDAAAGFRLYRDSYPLPGDCDKVLSFQRFGQTQPATRIGIEEMKRLKQFDRSEGPPEVYSVFDYVLSGDPTIPAPHETAGSRYAELPGSRLLQIHPFPDKAYRMEIWYKQHANTELFGTTQPFIPDSYRQVLVYGALSRAYPIFLNDLDRGQFYLALFNDLMALMSAQNKEYADDRMMIVPDMHRYRPARRRPRTAYTLGSYFDRWPMEP